MNKKGTKIKQKVNNIESEVTVQRSEVEVVNRNEVTVETTKAKRKEQTLTPGVLICLSVSLKLCDKSLSASTFSKSPLSLSRDPSEPLLTYVKPTIKITKMRQGV